MKIVFNAHNVGFGNNGGSRTLARIAEALSSLGHEVILYSNHKNKYTWHKIKGAKFMHSDIVPKSDIIIATGYKSVKSTIKAKSKKKFYYIRGFELWQASKQDLLKSYKALSCIVNSEWLLQYLLSKGIKADLVYPGLDFDDFYNINIDRINTIGGLFSKKHKTKKHADVLAIADKVGCSAVLLNKDIINPSQSDLGKWYSSIKIWISTSELEGLHNPPMEAAACGCALVCTDHPRGGTSDYALNNQTSLLYKAGDLNHAAECVSKILSEDSLRSRLIKNTQDILINKIGGRKKNMLKMIEIFNR